MLEALYAPLMARLAASSGTLKKLSFSVARIADVEQWASEAEEGLVDLRKAGAFRGKGTLLQKANEVLKAAWETGDSAAVRAAMAEFRRLYQTDLLDHSPVAHTDQAEFRAWSKRFAQYIPEISGARHDATILWALFTDMIEGRATIRMCLGIIPRHGTRGLADRVLVRRGCRCRHHRPGAVVGDHGARVHRAKHHSRLAVRGARIVTMIAKANICLGLLLNSRPCR